MKPEIRTSIREKAANRSAMLPLGSSVIFREIAKVLENPDKLLPQKKSALLSQNGFNRKTDIFYK